MSQIARSCAIYAGSLFEQVLRQGSIFTHLVGHSACDGLWTGESVPANVSAPPLAQERISSPFPLTHELRGGPKAAKASGFRSGQRRGPGRCRVAVAVSYDHETRPGELV